MYIALPYLILDSVDHSGPGASLYFTAQQHTNKHVPNVLIRTVAVQIKFTASYSKHENEGWLALVHHTATNRDCNFRYDIILVSSLCI